MTTQGGLRIATTLDSSTTLYYLFCDAACLNTSNWYFTGLFVARDADVALTLDANDRPRIAFSQGIVGGQYASTDENLYFAQCDTNCGNAANWSGLQIGQQYDARYGVQIAI